VIIKCLNASTLTTAVFELVYVGVRRNFFSGETSIFANPCQVADDAMQMDVHETLYPSTRLHHKVNVPCYDNNHKKCASLAATARYITKIFTIGYVQIFKAE